MKLSVLPVIFGSFAIFSHSPDKKCVMILTPFSVCLLSLPDWVFLLLFRCFSWEKYIWRNDKSLGYIVCVGFCGDFVLWETWNSSRYFDEVFQKMWSMHPCGSFLNKTFLRRFRCITALLGTVLRLTRNDWT